MTSYLNTCQCGERAVQSRKTSMLLAKGTCTFTQTCTTMNSDLFSEPRFRQALIDYQYLINQSYPEKGSLKLVGDRYKLETDLRTILYRGISSDWDSLSRKKRLTCKIKNSELVIDGYNVLFTLLNYRLGRFVFICTDQIVRDAGSLFGKIKKEELFIEILDWFVGYLKNSKVKNIVLYLDSPVSFSGKHKLLLKTKLDEAKIENRISVVRSADQQVKQHASGLICTSDSAIIDHTKNRVVDLPHLILDQLFKPRYFNLSEIISLNPLGPSLP